MPHKVQPDADNHVMWSSACKRLDTRIWDLCGSLAPCHPLKSIQMRAALRTFWALQTLSIALDESQPRDGYGGIGRVDYPSRVQEVAPYQGLRYQSTVYQHKEWAPTIVGIRDTAMSIGTDLQRYFGKMSRAMRAAHALTKAAGVLRSDLDNEYCALAGNDGLRLYYPPFEERLTVARGKLQ